MNVQRVLVVYESLFGDARTIAGSIADGLAERMPAAAVETAPAAEAPSTLGPDVGLLVVGGPNHQFGMARPQSRRQAARDFGAEVDPDRVGLKEWLAIVGTAPEGAVAAAYDTRLDHPQFLRRVDHASRTEEKMLRRLGYRIVVPAEHFFVTSPTGPLVAGEEERAREWGRALADQVADLLRSTS